MYLVKPIDWPYLSPRTLSGSKPDFLCGCCCCFSGLVSKIPTVTHTAYGTWLGTEKWVVIVVQNGIKYFFEN